MYQPLDLHPCQPHSFFFASFLYYRDKLHLLLWEQLRFTVIPGTSKPSALAAMIRPTCNPCSASGTAFPTITSSTRFASSCGTEATSDLMTSTARSSGRKKRNPPLFDFPTAVR